MMNFKSIIILFIFLFLFSSCTLAPAETIETIPNTTVIETTTPTIPRETQEALAIVQDTVNQILNKYKYRVYESNNYIYVDIWVQNIYSALRSESITFNDSWYNLLVKMQQINLQLQFLIRNTNYNNKITVSLYETLDQTDILLIQTYNGEIVFDYLTAIRNLPED